MLKHRRTSKARNALAAAVVVVIALLAWSIGTNANMRWRVVVEYLFDARIMTGLLYSCIMTVICMLIGVAIGTPLAIMSMSGASIFRSFSRLYIWFFRGIPLLVQIIFWFNIALIWPTIGFAIPSLGIDLSYSTNAVITASVAAVLALGLHEAAYMSEVIRGGLMAVDRGQTEAARSIGMTELQALRKIILPQAFRIIIPPSVNLAILLLKSTALVAYVGAAGLMTSAEHIYSKNYMIVPLLIVASLWYLFVTSILMYLQNIIERRLNRGYARSGASKKN